MTYRSFLRALRRTKARWGYSGYAYIRCARGLCPIEAVARGAGAGEIQKGDVWEAVRFLDMDIHSAHRVITAADHSAEDLSYRERRTRRALLTLITRPRRRLAGRKQ